MALEENVLLDLQGIVLEPCPIACMSCVLFFSYTKIMYIFLLCTRDRGDFVYFKQESGGPFRTEQSLNASSNL